MRPQTSGQYAPMNASTQATPTLKSPELLLPAGSLAKMRAAYDFGADAVYAGQPRYSLQSAEQRIQAGTNCAGH